MKTSFNWKSIPITLITAAFLLAGCGKSNNSGTSSSSGGGGTTVAGDIYAYGSLTNATINAIRAQIACAYGGQRIPVTQTLQQQPSNTQDGTFVGVNTNGDIAIAVQNNQITTITFEMCPRYNQSVVSAVQEAGQITLYSSYPNSGCTFGDLVGVFNIQLNYNNTTNNYYNNFTYNYNNNVIGFAALSAVTGQSCNNF